MRTTIFLLVALCSSQANAQYNYSIGNYINSVEQMAWNAARIGAASTYYNNNYSYGYNGGDYRRQQKRTAAELYQQRQSNLTAKYEYEKARREYILNTRNEHRKFLQEIKQNQPPRPQGSIGINGKKYPSYKCFLATAEGQAWRNRNK